MTGRLGLGYEIVDGDGHIVLPSDDMSAFKALYIWRSFAVSYLLFFSRTPESGRQRDNAMASSSAPEVVIVHGVVAVSMSTLGTTCSGGKQS